MFSAITQVPWSRPLSSLSSPCSSSPSIRHVLFLLAVTLSPQAARAASLYNAETSDEYCPENNVCITTFRFCGIAKGTCNFPDPTAADVKFHQQNPGQDDPSFFIYDDLEYNITWKNEQEGLGPVWLDWVFVDAISGEGENTTTKWRDNTTDGYYIFKPADVLKTFPTDVDHNNLTYAEAALSAWASTNELRITQASSEAAAIRNLANASSTTETTTSSSTEALGNFSRSQTFAVQNKATRNTIVYTYTDMEDQAQEERRNWRIGVGVGVGVGGIALIGISAYLGNAYGRRKPTKLVAEGSRRLS